MQELDKKIEEALACPCVEELREGACGSQFTKAFTCYVKNMKAEKVTTLGQNAFQHQHHRYAGMCAEQATFNLECRA